MERKNMKVAFHNLGCKVNAYETEAMEQILKNAGYEIVDSEPGADIYIINTCTVTNIADRKSRQMLHKAKKMNPDAVVVAAGCYTQTDGGAIEKDEAIDIVVGNNRKRDILTILEEYFDKTETKSIIGQLDTRIDINHTSEYEEMTLEQMQQHTRAYVKVQDGCNQFCSYCIIPYARGRVRSRRLADIKKEVTAIAGKGFKEVVITGIHVSSYGADLEEDKSLIDVIETAAKVPGIERVRLSSLEPGIITEEFMDRLSCIKEICPHFHLSLQSGCDTVLKRMNRKYTSEEYLGKCRIIRDVFPDAAITTDIIVGFPGETEEEFSITEEFAKQVNFAQMHIFKYSKRRGTKAAEMEGQIDDTVKHERSKRLIESGKKLRDSYTDKFIGGVKEVLFEQEELVGGVKYFTGFTKEYVKIAVLSEEDLTNHIVNVNVKGRLNDEILLAEM